MTATARLYDYLSHIIQAIARIERYVAGMQENDFLQDELVQDAVIRNIEIIGEASNNILKKYTEFAQENQHVPFVVAYQMRNAVAHGYFAVDWVVVWRTIKKDLPQFCQLIEALREKT